MVNFRDLPREAQDMLRDLSLDGAHMLSVQAGVARRAAEHAAYDQNPHDGARAARKALRRPVRLDLDDPVDFAIDVLDTAVSALDSTSFEGHQAPPLAALLSLAATAMRSHRENVGEATERLWVATHPQK